jgi:hypothetical protein
MEHLDAREVRYLTNSETGSIFTNFRGEAGTYRIVAVVDATAELFQVFGFSPVMVPAGARRAIAETVARANYGMRLGKFELDFSDGELRFQAAHVLTDDHLEDEVIGRLMGTTLTMLDLYLPAFLSVIYGNELPEDAVAHIEKGRPGLPDTDDRAPDSLD